MTRLVAALLVVTVSLAFAAAQEREPGVRFPLGGASSNLPFEVSQVDGKATWKVRGRGTVRIEDLIGGLANAHSMRISYGARAAGLVKEAVPYVGPDTGMTVAFADLPDYVSELLGAAELTIVGHSTGVVRVVRVSEAAGLARHVTAAELAALPRSEWVCVALPMLHAAPGSLGQMLDAYRRVEGMQVTVGQIGVVVTAQAEHARNVAKLVEELDQPGASREGGVVRGYDVPAGLQAAQAANSLLALFNETRSSVQDSASGWKLETGQVNRISVTVAAKGNRILVRAGVADHAEVEAALKAMQ